MALTFHIGELEQEDVQALLALHVAAMRGHSPPEACHVLPPGALNQPEITFFTARSGGRLACIGALKALGAEEAEIKSMRVAPAFARQGIGRAMLERLVAEARNRGYARLLLETGTTGDFAAANRLYDRSGFIVRGPFAGYPPSDFTRFMQLEL